MLKQKFFTQTAVLATFAASLSLTGCATLVNGESQKMSVYTKPAHAKLKVDGMDAGKTPVTLNLKRSKDHSLLFTLAGYKPKTIYLTKSMSGWFLGNLLIGGIIGIAVDATDGAMYKLSPQEISNYNSGDMKFDSDSGKLVVILVHNANKNWQKIGSLQKA